MKKQHVYIALAVAALAGLGFAAWYIKKNRGIKMQTVQETKPVVAEKNTEVSDQGKGLLEM